MSPKQTATGAKAPSVTIRENQKLPFPRGQAILICLLVVLAFWPAMRGGFIWDDESYILENASLRSPEGLWRIWTDFNASPQYYPMVFTSFWLEYHLWGLNPFGYHLVNVLLHAMSAVLLLKLLHGFGLRYALPAAALFALHPVQVESVAWVTERKNLLSGLFYFLAMHFFLSCHDIKTGRQPGGRGRRAYALSLVFFILGLLSKTVIATFPAAVAIILWWRGTSLSRKDIVPLVPFLACGGALGALTAWIERTIVGARGPDFAFSFAQRIVIAGRALWFYLDKLLWPSRLTFIYPRWDVQGITVADYFFPLAAVMLIGALWLGRQKLGKGPAAAAAFYVITLFPALGFFNFYPMLFSFVADHFLYLACIGPLLPAAFIIDRLGRFKGRPMGLAAHLPLLGVVLALAILTWRQGAIYGNQETLYADVLKKNPAAWMAHVNLAAYLSSQGRHDEAAAHYGDVKRLKPSSPLAPLGLGNLMLRRGRPADAIPYYLEAIRLDAASADAHNNMAVALRRLGKRDEALSWLNRSLANNPNDSLTLGALGGLAEQEGKIEAALAYYRRAHQSSPDNVDILLELGTLLASTGQSAEAEHLLRRARRLAPENPVNAYNLGVLLLQKGEHRQAARLFTEALRLNPGYDKARRKLAEATATERRP